MDHNNDQAQDDEILARLLARDLVPIGLVTVQARFQGWALLDDGVMFAFVDGGTAYLRAASDTAEHLHSLGAHKYPQMPYWSIPNGIMSNIDRLRQAAYLAADGAHLAASFGIDDLEAVAAPKPKRLLGAVSMMALAA